LQSKENIEKRKKENKKIKIDNKPLQEVGLQ